MMDRLRFRGLSFFLSAAVKGFASKGEICYNRYMDWCGWIGFLLCPGREIPFGVSAELCVLPAGKGWGKLIRTMIAWIKFHPLNLLPLGGTVLGIAQHLATTF